MANSRKKIFFKHRKTLFVLLFLRKAFLLVPYNIFCIFTSLMKFYIYCFIGFEFWRLNKFFLTCLIFARADFLLAKSSEKVVLCSSILLFVFDYIHDTRSFIYFIFFLLTLPSDFNFQFIWMPKIKPGLTWSGKQSVLCCIALAPLHFILKFILAKFSVHTHGLIANSVVTHGDTEYNGRGTISGAQIQL